MAYSSGDEKVGLILPNKHDPMARFRDVDDRVWDIQNFNMETMRDFPHRYREGAVPYKILKNQKLEQFDLIHKRIRELFIDKKEENPDDVVVDYSKKGKSLEPRIIQLIFEFYCQELKAGPIPINDFIS